MGKAAAAIAGVAFVLGCAGAAAETYPSRPITVVVGFAAGGPTDGIVRILGERMRASLGQPIVVENVAGAAGSIAIGRVVHAAPDGYTLSLGHWGTHVVNGAIYRLAYDLSRDLAPIALLPSNPMLVVAKKDAPAKNLSELIAWLKAKPGGVSVGTAGAGSATHVAGVYFQQHAGVPLQFVPYRGTGPALTDLIAGQIDMIVDQASNALPHVKSGAVKAYAVTSDTRLASAPEIPTADEAGLPGFHMSVWYGLWAPKGTPAEIVDGLNAAVVAALANPAIRARFGDLGLDIPPRAQQTPAAFAAYHAAEIAKWWPIIRAANIKAE